MKPLLVVSSAIARDAAAKIVGDIYEVTSYPDIKLQEIHGRPVLFWPDSPGSGAMAKARKLAKDAGSLKTIITQSQPKGWNAADALKEGWDYNKLRDWAKPLAIEITYEPPPAAGDDPQVSESQFVLIERLGLIAPNKKVVCNAANVVRFLSNHEDYGGRIWYDEFQRSVFTNLGGLKRKWSDDLTNNLTIYLQDKVGMFRVTNGMVDDAVSHYARLDTRNEPRDWIRSISWDKTPRISDFFSVCLGAKASPYTSAASHNFWVGLVARIMKPGCQNDHMVVLEGAQNAGKTSALRIIGGDWYAEASESVQSKDFFLTLKGRILVEIAELDAFSRAEVNRIKQVISCGVDIYREPYGRHSGDYPRTCILAGTTNDDSYLKDITGARRFWPIRCESINLQKIRQCRDQLFAEAFNAFESGATWHEMPGTETMSIQESRRDRDAYEDILKDKLGVRQFVTIAEAAELLGIPIDRFDRRLQKRVADALKKANYRRDQRRIDGKIKRGWELIPGVQGTDELHLVSVDL